LPNRALRLGSRSWGNCTRRPARLTVWNWAACLWPARRPRPRAKQKVPPLSAQALQSQLPPQVPNARLITQQVQLKPQGAAIGVVQHPLSHILWRLDGLAAQHQGGALADAGHGGGQFAMRIRHLRVGHWRHKQRVCQRAPQHGGAGVSLRSAEAPGGRVGSAAMPARFSPGSFRRLRRHQKSPAPAGFARGARGV